MIEPLRFNREINLPHEIPRLAYCNNCLLDKILKSNPGIAVRYCSLCPTSLGVDKKPGALLCKDCDYKIHKTTENRNHIRHILVVGPGLRKKVLIRGDGSNFPYPLDKVHIKMKARVFHNGKRIDRLPSTDLQFISGMSGKSLHIQVLGAKNLIASDILGSSDPYIIYSFCGLPLGTTRVQPRTTNPRWKNETFVVPMEENLGYPRNMPWIKKDMVRLEVYDYDVFTSSDFLGHIELTKTKLEKMALLANEKPIRIPLTRKESNGLLHIQLGHDVEYLYIKVVMADDLNKIDSDKLANPYGKVFIGQSTLIGTTQIIQSTVNPRWNKNNIFKIPILHALFIEKYINSQIEAFQATDWRFQHSKNIESLLDDFAYLPTKLAYFRVELFDNQSFFDDRLLGKVFISVNKLRKMIPDFPNITDILTDNIDQIDEYNKYVQTMVQQDLEFHAKENEKGGLCSKLLPCCLQSKHNDTSNKNNNNSMNNNTSNRTITGYQNLAKRRSNLISTSKSSFNNNNNHNEDSIINPKKYSLLEFGSFSDLQPMNDDDDDDDDDISTNDDIMNTNKENNITNNNIDVINENIDIANENIDITNNNIDVINENIDIINENIDIINENISLASLPIEEEPIVVSTTALLQTSIDSSTLSTPLSQLPLLQLVHVSPPVILSVDTNMESIDANNQITNHIVPSLIVETPPRPEIELENDSCSAINNSIINTPLAVVSNGVVVVTTPSQQEQQQQQQIDYHDREEVISSSRTSIDQNKKNTKSDTETDTSLLLLRTTEEVIPTIRAFRPPPPSLTKPLQSNPSETSIQISKKDKIISNSSIEEAPSTEVIESLGVQINDTTGVELNDIPTIQHENTGQQQQEEEEEDQVEEEESSKATTIVSESNNINEENDEESVNESTVSNIIEQVIDVASNKNSSTIKNTNNLILNLFTKNKVVHIMKWSELYPFELSLENKTVKNVQGYLVLRLILSSRGSVLLGIDEAVRQMTIGETAMVKCRYDYAYNSYCMGSAIPPRANMIFTLKLLEINGKGRFNVLGRLFIRFMRVMKRIKNNISTYFSHSKETNTITKKKSKKKKSKKKSLYARFCSCFIGKRKSKSIGDIDKESDSDSSDDDSDDDQEDLLAQYNGNDLDNQSNNSSSSDSSSDESIEIGTRPRLKPHPRIRKHLTNSVQTGAIYMWNYKVPPKPEHHKKKKEKKKKIIENDDHNNLLLDNNDNNNNNNIELLIENNDNNNELLLENNDNNNNNNELLIQNENEDNQN